MEVEASKVDAPSKVKHFFWLALHRRCWTAARRHRHGLQDSEFCILCDQAPEEIDHLLVSCVFSRVVWARTLSVIGLVQKLPTSHRRRMQALEFSRLQKPASAAQLVAKQYSFISTIL